MFAVYFCGGTGTVVSLQVPSTIRNKPLSLSCVDSPIEPYSTAFPSQLIDHVRRILNLVSSSPDFNIAARKHQQPTAAVGKHLLPLGSPAVDLPNPTHVGDLDAVIHASLA